ncbi:MAG: RepA protein [Stygiobacter sp.]|nr:MAG: RepA protein [Stygiobacter sp.]
MVKRTSKQDSDKVRSLDEYKSSQPEQLELFGLLGDDNKPYNNTIELYDFMPKFHWGNVKRINGQFLPRLEREFECRGIKYKLKLDPAKIEDKDGIVRDYYPSQREEIIEFALRKLMADGHGIFLDDAASTTFTLYAIQKALQLMKHGYKISDIKEALLICVGTKIEIISEDGKTVIVSHIIETLGLQTKEDWKGTGQKTKCFVRFNPLVTRSIRDKSFRRFNYKKNFELVSIVARQLHKRMSHHFLQASLSRTYEMYLTRMIRDFGLTLYKSLSHNIRELEIGLKELQAKEIILTYEIKKILDAKRRNKLEDALITIIAHPKFIADIILHNEHRKKLLGIFPSVSPR